MLAEPGVDSLQKGLAFLFYKLLEIDGGIQWHTGVTGAPFKAQRLLRAQWGWRARRQFFSIGFVNIVMQGAANILQYAARTQQRTRVRLRRHKIAFGCNHLVIGEGFDHAHAF